MDTVKKSLLKTTATQFFLAILVTGVAVYFIYNIFSYQTSSTSESFQGPTHVGIPDCMQESQKAAELYSIFASKVNSTEEGSDDLRELTLLLGKTSSFKKDLLSPSGIVSSTRAQPFSTAHDIEAVAETTARCLSKTIPERDLTIILDKWVTRGKELIRKLCTSYNLNENELQSVDRLFKDHIDDIIDIAKSRCLKGEAEIAGTKIMRNVSGYEDPMLQEQRPYKGYY
jgi:hypothetical protein